jgi:MerR family transcriptional regulator, thiopeptide resistance regulator
MSMHTVKQLARLSGVSVRTLHYYDQIGLLRPAQVGANGYRYYGRTELLRLQQILLHRELGLPLDAIAALLDDSQMSRVERLREHRRQLAQRAEQFQVLIATLDRTITELEGGPEVDTKQLYTGFSPEKQAGYEAELVERYGEPVRGEIEASRRHVAKLGPEAMARMRELAELEAALAQHCHRQTPAGDPTLDALLERHRSWVSGMWGKPCAASRYAGLADLYESHPDFRARYEQLAPGLADYLPAVMRAYAGTAAG